MIGCGCGCSCCMVIGPTPEQQMQRVIESTEQHIADLVRRGEIEKMFRRPLPPLMGQKP